MEIFHLAAVKLNIMENLQDKVPDWLKQPLTTAQQDLVNKAKRNYKESFATKVLHQAEVAYNRNPYDFEAALTLGKFSVAAAVGTTVQQKLVEQILQAISIDDKEQCNCSDIPIEPGVFASRHFIWRYVYSTKHSKLMPIMKCSQCGHLNATHEVSDSYKKHQLAQGSKKSDLEIYS